MDRTLAEGSGSRSRAARSHPLTKSAAVVSKACLEASYSRMSAGSSALKLDATRRFDQPLTAERLFAWHSSLFPTGRSGMTRLRTGAWHDDSKGPMQVVSGPVGREHVHFEAPKAERLDSEMGFAKARFWERARNVALNDRQRATSCRSSRRESSSVTRKAGAAPAIPSRRNRAPADRVGRSLLES
jgi:hypothetical protein